MWPAGTLLHRGHRQEHPAHELVPGLGDTRFAPLPATGHMYVSVSQTAALLESVLHELSGPDATIFKAQLAGVVLTQVELTEAVRLVDLRDAQLRRLELARDAVVGTAPEHYPCTRRWAEALQHRKIGGYHVGGIVWHSRQADLHARSHSEGLLGDLLTHRATEVAVLWHPHGPAQPVRAVAAPRPLLVHGEPVRLIEELAALTGAPIE